MLKLVADVGDIDGLAFVPVGGLGVWGGGEGKGCGLWKELVGESLGGTNFQSAREGIDENSFWALFGEKRKTPKQKKAIFDWLNQIGK